MWWQSIIDVGSIYFKMLSVSEVWRYMMGTAQIHSRQRLQFAFSPSKPWFPSKGNSPCKPRVTETAGNAPDAWTCCKAHFSSAHHMSCISNGTESQPLHVGHADPEPGNKMLLRRLDSGFRYALGFCYQVLDLFIKKNNL